MYRTGENPLERFPGGRGLEEDCGNWAVVCVKSRREKAFSGELARRGIGYYLPLYEKRLRRKDTGKVRKSLNPLFPGYVAVVKSEAAGSFIHASGHVADLIEVKDQKAFIKDLQGVQRILGEKGSFQVAASIPLGERVRIVFGPFIGLEGVVLEWRNTVRVGIGIQMFGQSIIVEAEPSCLVKA